MQSNIREGMMATIVGVHGINQQLKGAELLRNEWWLSLQGGIAAAGRDLGKSTLACAFYGALFRAQGTLRAAGAESTSRGAVNVTDEFDGQLLEILWTEAAKVEPGRVVGPQATVRGRTPNVVQSALRGLARSKFFVGVTEGALIGSLKQVRLYMRDDAIRSAAQESVNKVVTPETRVIVAHSLGSVVAYEALHRYAGAANWTNVRTLVTLGSPLGIANLIFDRLSPAPVDGRGVWPKRLSRWTNVSDDGDIVALHKRLGDLFTGVVDYRIDNEAKAHDVSPYLTAAKTGEAIADGL